MDVVGIVDAGASLGRLKDEALNESVVNAKGERVQLMTRTCPGPLSLYLSGNNKKTKWWQNQYQT